MFGVQTPLNAGCTDCNVSLPHFVLPFGICSVQSQLNVTFVLTLPATASEATRSYPNKWKWGLTNFSHRTVVRSRHIN
jgi:hypothetical protein